MWPRSLLISFISTSLAVWATLKYQAWVDRRKVYRPVAADILTNPKTEWRNSRGWRVHCSPLEYDQEMPPKSVGVERAAADADSWRHGADLVKAGEFDEAIRVLEGETLDPYNAYNLGVAWQRKGETTKAIAAYIQAIQLEPTLVEARVNLGAQLLKSGRLWDAESILQSAINFRKDAPSLAAAHSNLGTVLKRSGRFEEALEAYAQAVRWGAGRRSLMHIADLHLEMGNLDEALAASRRALLEDDDPHDTSLLFQAGSIHESLGEVEEAVGYFAKVIQLDSQDLEAAMRLGNCQHRLGQYHEALGSFLMASRLEPENPVMYELLHSTVDDARKASIGRESARVDDSMGSERDTGTTSYGVAGPHDSEESVGLKENQGSTSLRSSVLEGNRPDPDLDKLTMDSLFEHVGGPAAMNDAEVGPPDATVDIALDPAQQQRMIDQQATSASEGESQGPGFEDTYSGKQAEDRGRQINQNAGEEFSLLVNVHGKNVCSVPAKEFSGASVRIPAEDTSQQSELPGELEDTSLLTPSGFFLPRREHGPQDEADSSNDAGNSLGQEERSFEPTTVVYQVASVEVDIPKKTTSATAGAVGENIDTDFVQVQQVVGPDGAHEPSESMGTDSGREMSLTNGITIAEEMEVVETQQTVEVENVQTMRNRDPLIASNEGFLADEEVNNDFEPWMSASQGSDDKDKSWEDTPPQEKLGNDELPSIRTGDYFVQEAHGQRSENAPATGAGGDMDPPASRVTGQKATARGVDPSPEEARTTADATEADVSIEPFDVAPREAALVENMENATVGDAGEMGGPGEVVVDAEPRGWASFAATGGKETEVREIHADVGTRGESIPQKGSSASEDTLGFGPTYNNQAVYPPNDEQGEMEGAESTPSGTRSLSDIATTINGVMEPLLEEGEEQGAVVDSTSSADGAELGTKEGMTSKIVDVWPPDDGSSNSEGSSTGGDTNASSVSNKPPLVNDAGAPDSHVAVTEGPAGPLRPDADVESAGEGPEEDVAQGGTGSMAKEDIIASAINDEKTSTADRVEDSGAGDASTLSIPEEEIRRARGKAKLGLARFQQGQTRKALILFEKAASIDPGWWGGFFYTALAQYEMGNIEAAASSLTSALRVPAPSEAGEIAELQTLASKVLASISREKGSSAEQLKAEMDASDLNFAPFELQPDPPVAPPVHRSAAREDRAGSAIAGGVGAGRGQDAFGGVGSHAASMDSAGEGSTRAGMEADLASLREETMVGSAPSLKADTRPDDENENSNRWPFSRKGVRRERPSAEPSSVGGTSPGRKISETMSRSDQETVSGDEGIEPSQATSTRRDSGSSRRSGGPGQAQAVEGGWSREDISDDPKAPPTVPDVPPKKRWGWGLGRGGQDVRAGSGVGPFQDNSNDYPDARDAAFGSGSTAGGSIPVDPNASPEDILASMGLKRKVSLEPEELDGLAAGVDGPEDIRTTTESREGGGRKRGMLSRMWHGDN